MRHLQWVLLPAEGFDSPQARWAEADSTFARRWADYTESKTMWNDAQGKEDAWYWGEMRDFDEVSRVCRRGGRVGEF